MCSVQKEDFYSRNAFQPAKTTILCLMFLGFIKDELNTELFRTNSLTNDESKSALLKHASLS